ncbi:MAG: acyltransferase [Candidatus Sulfotelmatobacter sp.]|jgi:acetyltransferase-like isoleucine patch superfamily enzyme
MTLPVRQASVNLDDSEGFCSRVLTQLNSVWVSVTFSFSSKPRNLSLHYASDVSRRLARHIRLGSRVEIGRHAWLSTGSEDNQKIQLAIEDDCRIGARCTVSAKNSIHLERDVILASDVLIIDNNHAYEDVATPIARQGTTPGGTIRIGEGCRIGAGVAVICEKGELVLGNNTIVAPQSVVTRSFPPHSVLSGNPARIVRGLDAAQPTSLRGTLSSTNVEGGVRKKIAAEPCSTNSETAVASRQTDSDEAAKNRGLRSRAWQTISQQDLSALVSRLFSKLRMLWMVQTYPFFSIGKGAWAHYSWRVDRSSAPYISIAERVGFAQGVRLEVSATPGTQSPILIMEAGSGLQRRGMISARNHIHIMKEAIFGFSVRIMDHGFEDQTDGIAIGTRERAGGTIRIEDECWIGFGAVIVCEEGELVIGRHSVVGANCIITRSIPPYSVVAGDPARIVKQYDFAKNKWVLGCIRRPTVGSIQEEAVSGINAKAQSSRA